MDYASEIKYRVPMRDLVEAYGFEVNRAGFICCPFHGEKTGSMKIYDDHFCCYGCGAHGDAIDFTKRFFGLTFMDAVAKINNDFGLCLPVGRAPTASEKAEYIDRRKAADVKKKAKEDADKAYARALERYTAYDRTLSHADEKTVGTKEWVDALLNISTAEFELQSAMIARSALDDDRNR